MNNHDLYNYHHINLFFIVIYPNFFLSNFSAAENLSEKWGPLATPHASNVQNNRNNTIDYC